MKIKRNLEHGLYVPSKLIPLIEPFTKHVTGKFIDIGCGDGRVVMLSKEISDRGLGIEINEDLYEVASTIIGDGYIELGNFFDLDFSKYDTIYYYLLGSNDEERLIEKLNVEFNGTLILNVSKKKDIWDELDFQLIDKFDNVEVYKRKL